MPVRHQVRPRRVRPEAEEQLLAEVVALDVRLEAEVLVQQPWQRIRASAIQYCFIDAMANVLKSNSPPNLWVVR